MAEVRIIDSLASIDAASWNRCFAGDLEDHAYLLAIEKAGIPGFHWCYVIVEAQGMLLAAMPGFFTDYALDTTLEGKGKKITSAVRTLFPPLMTLKLACLGSPDTEYGRIGFHPDVHQAERPALLATLLAAFEEHAARRGHRLIGLKDIPAFDQPLWDQVAGAKRYRGITGLPVAALAIDFADREAYLARLSTGTRKDMRRKLRSFADIRIEQRFDIDDVMDRVMTLYHQTRNRAEMQFEELTPEFFRRVLRSMEGRAFFQLFYHGDRLLAANLLLRDEKTLLDKFFVMDGEAGREHNLYFLSWFANIDYCLAHGLGRYQSGQAAYENKLRLGSTLVRTTMYFKHQNRLIHRALKLVAPLLAADEGLKEAA